MANRKIKTADIHYYSDRLQHKLNNLQTSRAAVVEAPSGYGKTTAVRDYLEDSLPQSASVYWFTATDEAPDAGFRRLCREIEKIDGRAGDRLLRAGFPNALTIGEACDALRSIDCDHDSWLVIDNFQSLNAGLPPSFLTALLEHGGTGLHVVIVTQMLGRDVHTAIAGRGFLHITASDLRLEAGDVKRYYALAGAEITREDAQRVVHFTEGWIIAVYLQLRAFQETGTFSDTALISLMDHLVWERLTEPQQTFLLRLSPFETVTAQQACALAQCDALPVYALDALQSPFIRYERTGSRYELHSILSELLAHKRRERGEAFERDCFLRAGDLCRDAGRDLEALSFYRQAGDYGRILRLGLSAFYFDTPGGTPFYELALRLAQRCPPELMKERPLSMLQVAYMLLAAGMDEEFAVLMDKLRPMLDQTGDEASLVLGEWTLLSSYRSFPRLHEMTHILKQADSLFAGKHSRVITPDAPWCYGIYAPFLVFHAEPGEAEREADALEEYTALYSRLTGGHGSGADVLFRLELAHYRGDLHEAEILAYKTIFIAQSRRQKIIQLAATLHLAEITLEKGDTAGWRHVAASLEDLPGALRNIFALPSALETAQGLTMMELNKVEEVAGWLRNGDFSGRQLPNLESDRVMVYLGALLEQGKYAQLVGTARAMYPGGIQVKRHQDVYIALITAAGLLRSGDRSEASEIVRGAVRMALPDGLFTPLLYYSLLLDTLVMECIARDFPEQRRRFETAMEGFQSTYSNIYSGLFPDELPGNLTAREREVALLAAKGLKNSEIAKKLTVSESTVRFHLRTIFQKLDIDRRAKLAEKLL